MTGIHVYYHENLISVEPNKVCLRFRAVFEARSARGKRIQCAW